LTPAGVIHTLEKLMTHDHTDRPTYRELVEQIRREDRVGKRLAKAHEHLDRAFEEIEARRQERAGRGRSLRRK
jgi:hypothetical protein